jgi:hypothetical protein
LLSFPAWLGGAGIMLLIDQWQNRKKNGIILARNENYFMILKNS